jgi:16S rRNA (guanine966-N2)-methyltransferase
MAGFKQKQIRVIAGALKGRPLSYPEMAGLRPTMQRTKASVFDSLGGSLEEAVFVDLYAAAGGMGIEALSRGARFAHFVENDRRALECLQDNLERCGVGRDRCLIHPGAVMDILRGDAPVFDDATIVYADPPYESDDIRLLLEFFDGMDYAGAALLVVEHHKDAVSVDRCTRLVRTKLKKFGQSWVSYFAPARGETR